MKVCFVTQAFVRYADDAIGSFVFRLAEEMAGRGVDITVVAPHAPDLPDSETIGRTAVRRFRYAPGSYERLAYSGNMHDLVKGSTANKALLMSFLASFVATTVSTVRRQKSDIIHAHWWFPAGLIGAAASALTGVPLVLTCHGSDVGLLGRNQVVDAVAHRTLAYMSSSLYRRRGMITLRAGTLPLDTLGGNTVFTQSSSVFGIM